MRKGFRATLAYTTYALVLYNNCQYGIPERKMVLSDMPYRSYGKINARRDKSCSASDISLVSSRLFAASRIPRKTVIPFAPLSGAEEELGGAGSELAGQGRRPRTAGRRRRPRRGADVASDHG